MESVPLLPGEHSSKIVVVVELHVLDHPLEALSVTIVPGAETSSLLWPQVNHLSSHVSWVSNNRGKSEGQTHENCFDEVVTNIIVDPEQEELIFHENVEVHISGPEEELVECQWETSLEQVSWSLLKWNSAKSLGR